MEKRVVITGLGVISSVGNDIPTFWNNLLNGVCGIQTITDFPTDGLPVKIGGRVKDFDPDRYGIDKAFMRKQDWFTIYGVAAAHQAMEDSGLLSDGIRGHFGGNAEAFVRAYFAAVRDSLAFDFDVVGHPDLVRKFNAKHPYFDESAGWYREELERTADALAASGKLVEVNTGAISRGWLDDAYPSLSFRALLRERGVKFILSSDAHSADGLDCAFDRFENEEAYERLG